MSWFNRKDRRRIVGGRKDDTRIDGVLPRWPSPEPYSFLQKIGLVILGILAFIAVPVFGILVVTGLHRPVEWYFRNDATLGISSEIQNWWYGGRYYIDLDCESDPTEIWWNDVTTRSSEQAKQIVEKQNQPGCLAHDVVRVRGAPLGYPVYRVSFRCPNGHIQRHLRVSGTNFETAADFATSRMPSCNRIRAHRLCASGRRSSEWNCKRETKEFVVDSGVSTAR